MAKVLLTSSAAPGDRPHAHDELQRMQSSAEADRFGVHHVTDDPAEADVILYVENCSTIEHYTEVYGHPYYRKYPNRCFLFSRHDNPLPFLPGVYASLERRWYDPKRVRAGGYLRAFAHGYLDYRPDWDQQDYLYSFIGKANTHPVREKVMQLEEGDPFLKDTAPLWPYGELDEAARRKMQVEYREISLRSKFILCPRGRGTSSIRLFESLRMARPPVIISDQWVAPEGPDWDAFSLRVSERDVEHIPALLRSHEERARRMGERARETWENWFSRETTFHRTTEWCLDIISARPRPELLLKWTILPQLARPVHAKALARHTLRTLKQKLDR